MVHFLAFTKQIQFIVGYVFRVFMHRFSKHFYAVREIVVYSVYVSPSNEKLFIFYY